MKTKVFTRFYPKRKDFHIISAQFKTFFLILPSCWAISPLSTMKDCIKWNVNCKSLIDNILFRLNGKRSLAQSNVWFVILFFTCRVLLFLLSRCFFHKQPWRELFFSCCCSEDGKLSIFHILERCKIVVCLFIWKLLRRLSLALNEIKWDDLPNPITVTIDDETSGRRIQLIKILGMPHLMMK